MFKGQKPSKTIVLWSGNGFDRCNKTSSQYSTYSFIFISYVELCIMPTFQKSMYLDSPKLINISLTTDLDASLPQIGWYRIGFGTLISNFCELPRLVFHNLIGGPSIELHIGCCNPSLGLATKARVYKSAGQERENRECGRVWEWTLTLSNELPCWELESRQTPKSLESDCKGQNPLP